MFLEFLYNEPKFHQDQELKSIIILLEVLEVSMEQELTSTASFHLALFLLSYIEEAVD